MKWRTMCSLLAAVTSLGTGAGPAAAQRSVRDAPTFATLDRQDGTSLIGGQLAFTFLDDAAFGAPDGPGATGLRFDLYGQYVGRNRLGVYGILPLSRLLIEDFDDEGAIGSDAQLCAVRVADADALLESERGLEPCDCRSHIRINQHRSHSRRRRGAIRQHAG